MLDFIDKFQDQYNAIQALLLFINVIVHILFAGAVAKNAGQLNKQGRPTVLVSGLTWAFATLGGGVIIAVIYWILHHASFMKPK